MNVVKAFKLRFPYTDLREKNSVGEGCKRPRCVPAWMDSTRTDRLISARARKTAKSREAAGDQVLARLIESAAEPIESGLLARLIETEQNGSSLLGTRLPSSALVAPPAHRRYSPPQPRGDTHA